MASDTPDVTVPATVTIPAGSPGVSFPVGVAEPMPPGGAAQSVQAKPILAWRNEVDLPRSDPDMTRIETVT
ncbi:hypothetical protein AB0M46_10990 [Dactylosporangium sp. NPDC051485]|uniref:hypothetical protein n=1 Tax=Dactylosporangium sp. NPDC051485 TaxID=3154846 RepID=UPI0034282641